MAKLSDYRINDLIPVSEMVELFPGTTIQTWARARHLGTGPVYRILHKKVFYRKSDVEIWIDENGWKKPDVPLSRAEQAHLKKNVKNQE